MSLSLVKKSLEISVENDSSNTKFKKIKQCKKKLKIKKKQSVDNKKNALILIQKLREKSKTTISDKVEVNSQQQLVKGCDSVHKKIKNKLLNKFIQKNSHQTKKETEQKSVFTEEDFAKFEKEYFKN